MMDRSTRSGGSLTAASIGALLAVLVLAGCSLGGSEESADGQSATGAGTQTGPRVVQPGAPGETGRELTPEDLETIETPTHTAADVLFMQNMIIHHRQALAMTALVSARTNRKDLPLFAERIQISQTDEIERMKGWLETRGEKPLPYDPDVDHSGHLAGMLSPRQLARLEASSGRTFDLLFLRGMRRHHEGAIAMVDELQARGGGIEPEISNFTIHVVADQGIEISRINTLLADIARGR